MPCCSICCRRFQFKYELHAHMKEDHPDVTHPYKCAKCGVRFTLERNATKHEREHSKRRVDDEICSAPVRKVARLQPTDDKNVKLISESYDGRLKVYRIDLDVLDLSVAMSATKASLVNLIGKLPPSKVQLRVEAIFHKATDHDIRAEGHFNTKQTVVLSHEGLEGTIDLALNNLNQQVEGFQSGGSGWVLSRIRFMDVYATRYRPVRATNYIAVPEKLRGKHAIINVKNKDTKCFMWSILAALHPIEKDPQRTSHYKMYTDELDFTGITFPVGLDDVGRFEEQNGLSVSVLGYDDGLYPLYNTKFRDRPVIHLLYLEPNDDGPGHYCYIKNLNRLLFRETKHEGRKFICPYCLCPFNNQARLDKHHEFCTTGHQRVEMPEDTRLKFKNVNRQLRAPYVLYADFECFTKVVSDTKRVHVPNSYGLIGVKQCCGSISYDSPIVYPETHNESSDRQPVAHLLDTLIQRGEAYQRSCTKPMLITSEQQVQFEEATQCHICNKALSGKAVRDHCHVCGEYRGAAHDECNKKLYLTRDVSVFFHNLRKYDGHLIMQELGSIAKSRKLYIDCVSKTVEDYITFSIKLKTDGKYWRLRFLDSLAFLNASLDTLAASLPDDKFTALTRFAFHPELLRGKGLYPYEYMDSQEKFQEPNLPGIEQFYNKLKLEAPSEAQYVHAQKVFKAFGCRNLGDYHNLYLLGDVLLLHDVFQNFRDFCLEHYGLDPVHYITLPSFAWDALLKYTQADIDLLEDPNMYQFFTAGIRGGVSTVTHRYAKANNPYLDDYNPEVPNSYIMYLDANNLYGWAMKQPLPVSDFTWVGEMDEVPNDGYGYILEVDLEYPKDLHDSHNNYPLAPERTPIPNLSAYCRRLKEKLGLSDALVEKLVPSLSDKAHYIVHHRNLKQYIDQGLVLKKIHRGIRFIEEPWMAPYIDFNTNMRKAATTKFEKDQFKLMNNAVFGKSMEDVFSYVDIRLVTDGKVFEKLVANPRFKECRPFKNDLVAVSMSREKALLNKPIYTGFTVLDLSKTLMYDFHYQYMSKKYGDNLTLLFTDTDSLCYHVKTQDIYQDMFQDRDEFFDTSDYPKDHPLYSEVNKKVIGLMKDETNGVPIEEFVGLRAKMYSFKYASREVKKAKGITKPVVAKNISHDDYKVALFKEVVHKHDMTTFQNKLHEIYTVDSKKISLSPYDDKRYILEDGIATLAYGHYRAIDGSFKP